MATTERKLREARKRLGMTQGELAQALGVTQGTISRWESGSQDPDFYAVAKLAKLADVDLSYFLTDVEHDFGIKGSEPNCKIVGTIKQGAWVDAPKWEPEQFATFDIPIPDDLSGRIIEGYILEDESAEPFMKRGSIVFVDTSSEIDLRHEKLVVIAREDARGLFEVTLKEVYINHKGATYFSTVAQDPEFQDSFKLQPNEDDGVIESLPTVDRRSILGVVIASFRLE